jgi:hypothetical protein
MRLRSSFLAAFKAADEAMVSPWLSSISGVLSTLFHGTRVSEHDADHGASQSAATKVASSSLNPASSIPNSWKYERSFNNTNNGLNHPTVVTSRRRMPHLHVLCCNRCPTRRNMVDEICESANGTCMLLFLEHFLFLLAATIFQYMDADLDV